MAGIGFVLRRLNPNQSFTGLLKVYGVAGIISSGPWLLSIFGIMLIGLLSLNSTERDVEVVQFQVTVTYLFALSLILTGFLQLMFTRYIADRLFEDLERIVTPNLMGVLLVTTIGCGACGILVVAFLRDVGLYYRLLFVAGFVVLGNIWMGVVLLTGLKAYKEILAAFFFGYLGTVCAAVGLRDFGLEGLLSGFVAGHVLLFFMLLWLLLRSYPGDELVAFDFLRRKQIFPRLALVGFLYNFGIWIDKFLFWFNPATGNEIVGGLRASVVYDVPVFLAYMTIVPGMAVFLVRMETDFAELYEAFYSQVREGATLANLERTRGNMVYTVRQGIYEIFKVQGGTILIVYLFGEQLLQLIGMSPLYLNLFYIDSTAVGAQVLFLAILNVLFYLDLRVIALRLCLLFAVLNCGLTMLTQALGPAFYGYGFAVAIVATSLIGMAILSRKLDNLVSDTFMLQSVEGA